MEFDPEITNFHNISSKLDNYQNSFLKIVIFAPPEGSWGGPGGGAPPGKP